jgi:O-antigen ligase
VLDKTNAEIMFSDRTTRWQFAKDNWNMKFRWYHKLFGHGFDYMEWYGEKFMGDSKKFDWPHNPFISTILYSGIIGLVFYLLLLLKVFMLYIEYRKKYAVLLIGFLITFFFSFFSGSSPFDPPIMGFFIMLPFLIQSIHKKDNCKNNA